MMITIRVRCQKILSRRLARAKILNREYMHSLIHLLLSVLLEATGFHDFGNPDRVGFHVQGSIRK